MSNKSSGVIGQDLLKRIAAAEKSGDWDLVIELLAMAQIEAMKNYKDRLRKECKNRS